MKVVIYCRTRADDGSTLEAQERAGRQAAKRRAHSVIGVWRDVAVDGDLTAREGLAEALERLRRADALWVESLEVLAADIAIQECVAADVWGRDAALLVGDEMRALQKSDASGNRRVTRNAVEAALRYERLMVSLRLSLGRRRSIDAGGPAGAPPFGMKLEGGKLVVDREEDATVDIVCALYDEGKALRDIAAALTAQNRKTRQGREIWHLTTVKRLLDRASEQGRLTTPYPRARGRKAPSS